MLHEEQQLIYERKQLKYKAEKHGVIIRDETKWQRHEDIHLILKVFTVILFVWLFCNVLLKIRLVG